VLTAPTEDTRLASPAHAGTSAPIPIGFYFDLYSDDTWAWRHEAVFNASLKPAFLEVMLEYPVSCGKLSADRARTLRELLAPLPLTVHAPTLNLSLVSLNPAIRKASCCELLRALDVTATLGAKAMTFHAGAYPYHVFANGTSPLRLLAESLEPLLTYAHDLGVTLCIENLKGTNVFPVALDEIDAVLDSHPSLMLAMDIRHLCVAHLDPLASYTRYRTRIRAMHYRVDCGLSCKQLTRLLTRLVRANYQGGFIIEGSTLNSLQKDDKTQIKLGLASVLSGLATASARSNAR
jgi:sugar phosphate isomerase/epimerase